MNKHVLIKICGIKTPSMAAKVVKMGADFIGVVLCESSKRFITSQIAKMIFAAVENRETKVVGVFVNNHAAEILNICKFTGIRIVQLYGEIAKREAYKLPQNIIRFYVINVDYQGGFLDDQDKENIRYLNPQRDYLLFDGIEAGSGKTFDLSRFQSPYDFPFFLAGGLNASNLKKSINVVKPDGVDVSSGVENIYGEKDQKLIEQFIAQVRKMEKK